MELCMEDMQNEEDDAFDEELILKIPAKFLGNRAATSSRNTTWPY